MIESSDQQKAREESRKRALERLQNAKQRFRLATNPPNSDAATASSSNSKNKAAESSSSVGQHRNADRPLDQIAPVSKKFKNYIEFDFSKMQDSRGGFMLDDEDDRPKGMSLEEWKAWLKERQPTIPLDDPDAPECFECGTVELDFRLYNWFKTRVCRKCRNKNPDKYSLLTKTECREDYLLTDPELRDEELLPHVEKPNPHKNTYNNMMLYMRYQVEVYAFKKWNGSEGLDAEYERRVQARKKRKDKKFLEKLKEMRRKTRAEALTRKDYSGPHNHQWGEPTDLQNGMVSRRCMTCGLTTEEISMG